jgi:hypothetical protein
MGSFYALPLSAANASRWAAEESLLEEELMQTWRKIIMILMIVAITGPWAIERLNIPIPNECDSGFRLDEDFCGVEISGLFYFIMLFGNIFSSGFQLVVGEAKLQEFVVSILFVWFVLSPPISTLLFTASKEKPFGGGEKVHISILSFAVVLGLVGIILSRTEMIRELWGIWLFMLVLAIEWVLEVFMLEYGRRLQLRQGMS